MIEGYVVYNSIFLLALLFGFMKNYCLRKYFLLCLFLVLWVPLATRYGIGRDYFSYVDIYKNVLVTRDGIEVGFYYLNYLLAYFGFHYQSIFILTSFITIYLSVKSFDREYTIVSIILFGVLVYLQAFSIVRQMLAVAVCLYSCLLWNKGVKIKAIIFLMLAPLFHYSAAIIFILAIISRYVKIDTFKCFAMLGLSLIFVFVFNGIDFIFSNPILLNSKYGYYVTSAFNRPTEIGSGIGVAIALFLPFLIFMKASKIYKYNKNYNLMLLINLVYVVSFVLSLKIYIFARFTDALSFVLILLIPAALKISNTRGLYYNCMLSVVILHIMLFEVNLKANTIAAGDMSNSELGIMPYSNIINAHMLKY